MSKPAEKRIFEKRAEYEYGGYKLTVHARGNTPAELKENLGTLLLELHSLLRSIEP